MAHRFREERAISNDHTFSECVVLKKDTFDPDEVFYDDIVDDDVLPRLSLAVDGLTESGTGAHREMEMHPEDAANDAVPASSTLPASSLDPEHLEVYGWESSFWRKMLGYLKF